FWDKGISPAAIAAVAATVLVVVVVILALVKLLGESGGGGCGDVRVGNPSPRAAGSEPGRIQGEASNPRCVRGVSYRIAGRQFARPLANPFEAILDPSALKERFPDLANGEHELSIAIETKSGREEVVADSLKITIGFPGPDGGPGLKEIRE